MIVDLFAGPRGWSEGLRILGLADVGIELDPAACATAAAAGHLTIRADVARVPLNRFVGLVVGLIASPPCPMFSAAGNGAGRIVLDELAGAIVDALAGRRVLGRHRRAMARKLRAAYLAQSGGETRVGAAARAWHDATQAALTVEPARWIAATRPRWVALEQVPAVLPLWQTYARALRGLGYRAWAGILNAADYGVPQTRRRAILLASLDRPVEAPAPTHCRCGASTLFGELRPWVSMAEALGWGLRDDPSPVVLTARNRQTGHDVLRGSSWRADWFRRQQEEGNWVVRTGTNSMKHSRVPDDMVPYERPVDDPAPTLDRKAGKWHIVPGDQRHRARPTLSRPLDQPAPTLAFGHDSARWAFERPATTIAGDSRCWPPGHKVNADDRRRLGAEADERYGDRAGTDAIRLTIADALILQSFRPDYPVQGTKTKQFEQVGNAVPPLLAAHVLAAVTGRTLDLGAAA